MSKHVADFETIDGQLYLVLDSMRIAIPPEAKSAFFGLVREAMDEGYMRQRIADTAILTALLVENSDNDEITGIIASAIEDINS
jgi:hypothetical protein